MDDFTLSFALDFFEDRMPLGFLPIAHDSGGGLLLLDCRVATAGRIFYWDHCCGCCDVNSLEYVCDSFGELENMFVQ
jgi:hypothetical protein